MVEKALHMRTASPRRMKRLLSKLAPGDAVMLNWPRGKDVLRPAANEIPFEPIDLDNDHDGQLSLMLLNVQEQGEGQVQELLEDGDEEDHTAPHIWEVVKSVFWVLWMIGGLGYLIRELITAGGLTSVIPLVLILGGFLALWVMPLIAERKWWLVPGGVICRESRLWRRGHRAELITPAQSPLIIDMRSEMVYLLHGRSIRSYACLDGTAWAVAAGWMSRARTPTMAEVRAFLMMGE